MTGPPWWVQAGWRSCPEILAALRTLYSYTEREPDRATGWLYSARQIGTLPATPWPGPLAELGPWMLADLAALTGVRFDAACYQAYLNGSGCGWHYDRDWAAQAILSLGVTRSFGLRRITAQGAPVTIGVRPGAPQPDYGAEETLRLAHGDLLFMPAGMQDSWEHCVPVEQVTGERCSIVFRSAA